MPEPFIHVDNLSVAYDQKIALANIQLDIYPDRIYGLIGPNGAGKSTLFKAILGLVEPRSGYVRVFGGKVTDHRKRVVYVPQKNDVDWTFPATVWDIVLMGRYPHHSLLEKLEPEDFRMAENALQELGITDLRNRQIGALSGGQQQRVFLARAICQQADIIFLDEPFVGVDITTEERIMQVLRKLAASGKCLLVVHHDLSRIREYFDDVILINQRLVAAGPTPEVFNPDNVAKAYGAQLTLLQQTGLLNQ